MSWSTVRLAALLLLAIVLVAACNGQGGLPLRPDAASYNFARTLGNQRTATFTNQLNVPVTGERFAINTNGFLGVGAENCARQIAANPGNCRTTIELTADPNGPNGILRILFNETVLGEATLIH